jgi:hypothetical protein
MLSKQDLSVLCYLDRSEQTYKYAWYIDLAERVNVEKSENGMQAENYLERRCLKNDLVLNRMKHLAAINYKFNSERVRHALLRKKNQIEA